FVDALLDETQLFKLLARVEPAPAFAALGHDQSVAILPTADRRGRQTKHPGDGPDAVDAAILSQDTVSVSKRSLTGVSSSARCGQYAHKAGQEFDISSAICKHNLCNSSYNRSLGRSSRCVCPKL